MTRRTRAAAAARANESKTAEKTQSDASEPSTVPSSEATPAAPQDTAGASSQQDDIGKADVEVEAAASTKKSNKKKKKNKTKAAKKSDGKTGEGGDELNESAHNAAPHHGMAPIEVNEVVPVPVAAEELANEAAESLVMPAPHEATGPPSPLRRSARRKAGQSNISNSIRSENTTRSNGAQEASPQEQTQTQFEHEAQTSPRVVEDCEDNQYDSVIITPARREARSNLQVNQKLEAEAVQRLESVFRAPRDGDEGPDESTIAEIIARSPMRLAASPRRAPREDPIEALDALEDALDAVDRALPAVEKRVKRPSPSPDSRRAPSTDAVRSVHQSPVRLEPTSPSKTPALKPAASLQDLSPKSSGVTRTSQMKTQTSAAPEPNKTKNVMRRTKSTNHGSKPVATASSEAATAAPSQSPTKVADKLAGPQKNAARSSSPVKEAREAKKASPIAALQAPAPVVKSSKPVTRPSFQLPGEAMAAKLKAQREERVKRQEAAAARREEEAQKQALRRSRSLHALPSTPGAAHKSILVERNRNSDDTTAKPSPAKRPLSTAVNGTATPRTPATMGRPKSMVFAPTSSATDTERRPRPSSIYGTSTVSSAARIGNDTPARGSGTPKPEVSVQVRQEHRAPQLDAREKAEAARKARAEAAERGRQASREWAEKMMRKHKAAEAAKRDIVQC